MKVSYLVDTDWVIDHLNRKSEVTEKLKELKAMGIALSIISLLTNNQSHFEAVKGLNIISVS